MAAKRAIPFPAPFWGFTAFRVPGIRCRISGRLLLSLRVITGQRNVAPRSRKRARRRNRRTVGEVRLLLPLRPLDYRLLETDRPWDGSILGNVCEADQEP